MSQRPAQDRVAVEYRSRSLIAVMRHPQRVLSVALSSDHKRAASSDGSVRLWEVFCQHTDIDSAATPRCLIAAQREASFSPAEPRACRIEMAK
jgi:WD40 repeat protein